jgi:decaprenyl-phosphate phosphoribosyltransferase
MNFTTVTKVDKSLLIALIKTLRTKQWVKNTFVFAPNIFAGKFLAIHAIGQSLLAMFLFCIASSAAYIVNDIHDIENDKKHSHKSKIRPLAAGKLKVAQAIYLLIALYLILAIGFLLQFNVMLVISAYLILNFAYTFFLKQQPVVDIFCIALGFVLRVLAGAVALQVALSSWMFVTTLCLALYLAAIKRRQELLQNGISGRKVLDKYSVALVNRYAEISASGALVFYSLYVMSTHEQLVITIPFVLYGLFRYWFVVECLDGKESPTDALLADWHLLATVFIWSALCLWVLWPTN